LIDLDIADWLRPISFATFVRCPSLTTLQYLHLTKCYLISIFHNFIFDFSKYGILSHFRFANRVNLFRRDPFFPFDKFCLLFGAILVSILVHVVPASLFALSEALWRVFLLNPSFTFFPFAPILGEASSLEFAVFSLRFSGAPLGLQLLVWCFGAFSLRT